MTRVQKRLRGDNEYSGLVRRAKASAALRGITLKKWLAEAIREKLERESKER